MGTRVYALSDKTATSTVESMSRAEHFTRFSQYIYCRLEAQRLYVVSGGLASFLFRGFLSRVMSFSHKHVFRWKKSSFARLQRTTDILVHGYWFSVTSTSV